MVGHVVLTPRRDRLFGVLWLGRRMAVILPDGTRTPVSRHGRAAAPSAACWMRASVGLGPDRALAPEARATLP